jgi:hypothetical protein
MAVKVGHTARGSVDWSTYPDANRFAIDDTGHLLVQQHTDGQRYPKLIAAYPPGQWRQAETVAE